MTRLHFLDTYLDGSARKRSQTVASAWEQAACVDRVFGGTSGKSSIRSHSEAGVVNVVRGEPTFDQQRSRQAGKVDVRPRPASIDEQFRLGVRCPKLIDDFFLYFEAADADGRPEPSLSVSVGRYRPLGRLIAGADGTRIRTTFDDSVSYRKRNTPDSRKSSISPVRVRIEDTALARRRFAGLPRTVRRSEQRRPWIQHSHIASVSRS
jgi:hypothetical protein